MMLLNYINDIIYCLLLVDCLRCHHLKTSHTDNTSARLSCENCTSDTCSIADGSASNIPPEFFKTAISLGTGVQLIGTTLNTKVLFKCLSYSSNRLLLSGHMDNIVCDGHRTRTCTRYETLSTITGYISG